MAYLHLENSDTPVLVEDRDLSYLAGRRWFLRDGDVVGEDGVRAIDVILEERGGRLRDGNPLDLRRGNLELDRGVSYLPSADAWRAAISHQRQPFTLGKSRDEAKARRMYVERAPDMRRLLSGRALGLKPTNFESVVYDPASGYFARLEGGRVVKVARQVGTLHDGKVDE